MNTWRSQGSWPRKLAAVGVACIGPLVLVLGSGGSWRSGAVAVFVAGAVILAAASLSWWIRMAASILAGGIVAAVASPLAGILLTLGILLAVWLVIGPAPIPGLPDGDRARKRVVDTIGSVVAAAMFALLAVPVVLVPWLVAVVARVDILDPHHAWSRASLSSSTTEPWSDVRSDRSHLHRARLGLVGVALFALVTVPVVVLVLRSDDGPPPAPEAFAGAPWYPEYFEDMNWVLYSEAYKPADVVRVRDVRTRHVNVEAGRRRTWTPPECAECPHLRVWFYGGSTGFGLGQRDEHTIASDLARAAWDDGVVLDVENRGIGGDTHWEEAQRFAWDVTADDPPDLVIFYDGTNEIMATRFGSDPDDAPSVIPAQLWEEYLDRVPPDAQPPPDAELLTPHPTASTAEEVGDAIGQRYERARRLSRMIAVRNRVAPVWVWQPTAERRPAIAGEMSMEGRNWALDRLEAARSVLGDDVLDMATLFDNVDEPLFYDQVHTNELGAEIVGRALYDRLHSEIRELAAEQPER